MIKTIGSTMMTPLSPSSSMNYESLGYRNSNSNSHERMPGGTALLEPRSNDYSRYGIDDVPRYTTTTAFGKVSVETYNFILRSRSRSI